MALHELGMKFNSPFVNLFIPADDYITLLENLEFYLGKTVENITPVNGKYPIGLLGGRIELHFLHYTTFEDAVNCWNRRLKRINKDNLYVIMTERDGCTMDHLKRFGNLSFKHKVAFCSCSFGKDKTFYYVKGFESLGEVDMLSYGKFTLVPEWMKFNWATFFNEK